MLWVMLGKTGKSRPGAAGMVVPRASVLKASTVPDGGIPLPLGFVVII